MDFPHLALKRAVDRQAPVRGDADPNTVLAELLQAKKESDRKNYPSKHDILRRLIKASPDEFVIDSEEGGIYGITHVPSGFKIHMPKVAAPPELKRAQPVDPLLELLREKSLLTGSRGRARKYGRPEPEGRDYDRMLLTDDPEEQEQYKQQLEQLIAGGGYERRDRPGGFLTATSPDEDISVYPTSKLDDIHKAWELIEGGMSKDEAWSANPSELMGRPRIAPTGEEEGRKLALGIYKNAGRLARAWTRGLGGPIESAAQNFPTLDDYTSEMLMPPRPSEAPFYAPKLSFWQNLKNVFKRPVERREKDRRNSESLWRVQQAIGNLDRPQPSYTRHGYAALMQATKRKQNFMVNMIQRNPNEFRLLSDNGNMTNWLHMSSGREFKVPTNPSAANRMNVSVSEPDMKRWVQAQRYRTGKMTGTQARRYMGS